MLVGTDAGGRGEGRECGAQHRRRGGSPEKLVRGGRALR
jgi:hypothetical protein